MAKLDEEYVTKMEDVLALYEKPYEPQEPVVCLDEKPVSLHAEVHQPVPAAPGRAAKRDSEYQRCGTANVFCAVEAKAGRHFTWPTPDRSGPQFAKVIRALVGHYPWARTIHLVLDNLNIHCRKSLTDSFGPKEGGQLWRRLKFHHTPKHGSWLNQAEIEISLFSRQCLGRRRIGDLATLIGQARAWNRRTNQDHHPMEVRSQGCPENLWLPLRTSLCGQRTSLTLLQGKKHLWRGDQDTAAMLLFEVTAMAPDSAEAGEAKGLLTGIPTTR